MSSIPPWPQDFLVQVISDTVAALQFDEAPIRERVAASLGGDHMGIITAEDHARVALGEAWRELASALACALEEVEAEYEQHPGRAASVRAELEDLGADSWIANAVCARLAFDVGFDALGDIGGLTEF